MTSGLRNREGNVTRKFHDVHHTMQLRINVKCRELHSSLIGLADRPSLDRLGSSESVRNIACALA